MTHKILVIDDSELVSKLLRDSLTEAGYDVVLAVDADTGYQRAVETLPDLILLDIQLPDVTGFELLRVLRNRHELEHVPVIMITGTHHATAQKVKGFQFGADDYVLKPFEISELLERLKVHLKRSDQRKNLLPRHAEPAVAALPLPAAHTPSTPDKPAASSVFPLAKRLLLDPFNLKPQVPWPSISRLVLFLYLILAIAGMALAAGPLPKVALVLLLIPTVWASLVAVLVMSASLAGVPMSWHEGATVISSASLPLLIKMACAVLFSFYTTLSPFYFSASPGIFFMLPQGALAFLDLFYLWAALLLWIILQRRTEATAKSGAALASLIWGIGILWAYGLARFGL